MKEKGKIYKDKYAKYNSMTPGDPQGSPDESFSSEFNETLVFVDDGFLAKLSKHFGQGEYLKFDRITFAQNLAKKQKLVCKHIFYYTAPPFQSPRPTKEEEKRKEGYDRFVKKLLEHKSITIRESRIQRLKIEGGFIYKQKAVDSLAIIDLMSVPIKYPTIEKIILCTYYERGRDARFSTSNELIKSVNKYVLIKREDFNKAVLNKSGEQKEK